MTNAQRVRLRSPLLLSGAIVTALLFSWPGLAWTSSDPAARPRLSLEADAPEGMCALGDTVRFTAAVKNTSKEPLQAELRWELVTVAFEPPAIEPVEIEVAAGEVASFVHELEMSLPGFVKVNCALIEEGGKRPVRRSKRIGCEPTRVLAELTAEEDLAEFWATSLEELAEVDPDYELIEMERDEQADSDLYELIMHSWGDVRVRGWLEVPRTEGPHPALLRVPGYTQNMQPLGQTDGAVVLSFNIRGHGKSTDDIPGNPKDFWVRGLDDKDTYYYRGAYLDCVRAVDYLASREDVDTDRIVVWGGSQGGGLAFSTAALDQRIDLCIADIPWLCDWKNYLELAGKTDDEEITAWLEAKQSRTKESTLRTLSYFDTMNLADRIQCPTLMGVGLQDTICPPSTSFATFNRITAPTDFRIYEDSGHGLGREHLKWILAELEERLGPEDS